VRNKLKSLKQRIIVHTKLPIIKMLLKPLYFTLGHPGISTMIVAIVEDCRNLGLPNVLKRITLFLCKMSIRLFSLCLCKWVLPSVPCRRECQAGPNMYDSTSSSFFQLICQSSLHMARA